MAADQRMTRGTESKSNAIPLDLIQEILVRLRAIDLLRFRCVSKLFLSLLTNTRLIQKHAIHANENTEHQRLLSCLCHDPPFYTLNLGKASSQMSDSALKELPSCCISEIKWGKRWAYVAGTCNGLVCMAINDFLCTNDYLLLNPFTRESYQVPSLLTTKKYFFWSYGFGFDRITEDYKIVRVCRKRFDVFSVKNNSWKSRNIQEPCPLARKVFGFGRGQVAVVHGALHWEVGEKSISIVSFDLAQEKVRVIMLPPRDQEERPSAADRVGVLQGCLSLTRFCTRTEMTCVWIMKEYGVTESWMKSMTVEIDKYYKYWTPICYTAEGEIIFRKLFFQFRMPVYNPELKILSTVEVPKGIPMLNCHWSSTYVETLVSIKEIQRRESDDELHNRGWLPPHSSQDEESSDDDDDDWELSTDEESW